MSGRKAALFFALVRNDLGPVFSVRCAVGAAGSGRTGKPTAAALGGRNRRGPGSKRLRPAGCAQVSGR
jgi:hypothetical protein